jgi:hypothetical protein
VWNLALQRSPFQISMRGPLNCVEIAQPACEKDGKGWVGSKFPNQYHGHPNGNEELVLSQNSNYQYMYIQTKFLELQSISVSWLI